MTDATKDNRPMTAGEVSAYLRYSKRTIQRLAHEGELPGKLIGKEWRFPRDQIIALAHGVGKR